MQLDYYVHTGLVEPQMGFPDMPMQVCSHSDLSGAPVSFTFSIYSCSRPGPSTSPYPVSLDLTLKFASKHEG